ncbi:hypothetical protein [Mycolicibacterium stellerae]|uniref:hypothetical protein n=1 Tax=Mycolicibacterium stellerae TaxID=2358193 RepID=UPI000F0B2E35|nr:hypothetical protein [Mycolicibacterium stellerae]
MPAARYDDPARYIIEFESTREDMGVRPTAAAPRAGAAAGLSLPFPNGTAPKARPLAVQPSASAKLPRADVLVVTWTAEEAKALADVFTPGFPRDTKWYKYKRLYNSYVPEISANAPARSLQRLGTYFPSRVAGRDILCVKSDLHLNQDGVRTGNGTATLPVKRFLRQIIDEVKPSLVITVGTAGATFPPAGTITVGGMNCPAHELGDVIITRGAKFHLTQEFKNEPFASTGYRCQTFQIPQDRLDDSSDLLAVHAEKMTEPPFGVPTSKYGDTSPIPIPKNKPDFRIDGVDFPEFHPVLSADSFVFGTSTNGLEQNGSAVEMGDAVLGMVVDEMAAQGLDAPDWLVIRNVSDPQINGELPGANIPGVPPAIRRALNMQVHWAVWYYETYGYWTSVNSAIAVWAMTA